MSHEKSSKKKSSKTNKDHLTVKRGLKRKWKDAVKKNSVDAYSYDVVKATCAVGKALDQGKSCEEATKACHDLGITGFMAGCMAEWIAFYHPRGEEFRRFWNKDNAIGDEGDEANESGRVLNPALMEVSLP